MARVLQRWVGVGALVLAGCMAPVLPPVHPTTALPNNTDKPFEFAGAIGYAASPAAGLGQAVVPGSPYLEGEVHYAVARPVQLQAGLGVTFHSYFVPWPSSLTLGAKFTLYDQEGLALAIAPRGVFGTTLNLFPGAGGNVFGTRDLGGELPLIATHRFANRMALSVEVWFRIYYERQEDSSSNSNSGAGSGNNNTVVVPVELGYSYATGLAVIYSFPRLRDSETYYHVFFGGEELWLTQTGAQNTGSGISNPLIGLSRFSLTAGFGMTLPY
jgi:hypothetical protein